MIFDKLVISVEGKELVLIDGMVLDGGLMLIQDGKGVNSQVNYIVNSFKLQGQDMGSGKFILKVDNVDGQVWYQFSQQYSVQFQVLLVKLELVQNLELYQQVFIEMLFNVLLILFKGNLLVIIFLLSWCNVKGESIFNFLVLLKDLVQVIVLLQILVESLDCVVQFLDGKVVILVDMVMEFMIKIVGLEGYQLVDVVKFVDQQVKGLVVMGQMFCIIIMEDNVISSSLQYVNGQVMLNGQKMLL